jgi:hypothetical protein
MNRPSTVSTTATIAKARVFMLSSFVHLVSLGRRRGGVSKQMLSTGQGLYMLRLAAIASFSLVLRHGAEQHVIKQPGTN